MQTLPQRLEEYQCFEHCPGCECEVTREADIRFGKKFSHSVLEDILAMLPKKYGRDIPFPEGGLQHGEGFNTAIALVEAALTAYCIGEGADSESHS